MDASKKSPAVEALLSSITGRNRVDTIKAKSCVFCGDVKIEFRDEISEKEYTISGMCQECQDSVFMTEDK